MYAMLIDYLFNSTALLGGGIYPSSNWDISAAACNAFFPGLRILGAFPFPFPFAFDASTLEGNSTALLYTVRIDTAFFHAFGDDGEALGKGSILEAPQGNFAVFESFIGSRSQEVGWREGFSGLLDLRRKQRGHS
jgi:hypothetical protein